jgi:uncharacterized protein YjcR
LNEVRAPNYELAETDYMDGMKYKDIAKKYNVSLNTVKSWKTRYNWSRDAKNGVHTKNKKVCTQKGGQPGNKNAVGNKGGAAPEGNKNAEKHGFFAKWLPEETREIMGAIQSADPLDLLWDNIQLQYTAIIRAQKLMYVKDQKDKTIEKIEHGYGETSEKNKWEVQQAWDKHATFLQAQSRAMKTLESMIRQYDELLNNNRDMVTEEQRQRISLLKAQTDKLTGNNQEIEDLSDVDGDIYGKDN